jgi:hypothetical protein
MGGDVKGCSVLWRLLMMLGIVEALRMKIFRSCFFERVLRSGV